MLKSFFSGSTKASIEFQGSESLMSMSTRQLEEAYLREVERIHQKVYLGEIPQDAGEFLIMLAREKTNKSTKRLKRSNRLVFNTLAAIFSLVFLYCFFEMYRLLDRNDLSFLHLHVLGVVSLIFVILFQMELMRIEKLFGKFFSKAYFKKILHAPEIEFEWKRVPMIQVRLILKNENNLYAGLKDEEVCELKSNIMSTIIKVLDDGQAYLEEISDDRMIVNYFVSEGVKCEYVTRQIDKLFNELKLMDGVWFSKSVRMGAGLVLGEFLVGNMGYDYQVFRTAGCKTGVAESLALAAGWDEILMDEVTYCELDSEIRTASCEPVFVRSSSDLIKVYKFLSWKESNRDI